MSFEQYDLQDKTKPNPKEQAKYQIQIHKKMGFLS